ncbi:Cation/H(+) antiporter like [Heracleum sosnowskyi]|uniref:Cation/H(+) antiporter like n=1 Tax=Heracleum sosnowskyi TaxID=360622 RepID=A0AAD8HX80_9APIA|nr:Cation/H(+) antiporter like [Heracleum sosnowskyi]
MVKSDLPIEFEPNRTICRHPPATHSPGIFYGKDPLQFSIPLLLLEMSMVILITRLVHYLLKPFKQPRIVSEIIGGLIIGPSCLGHNKEFSSYLFPDNSEFVMKTFGVLGFMYFLFLCGVQTDFSVIQKATRKQWYIALYGVLIPLSATLIVALCVRDDLSEELQTGASIWGVASSLSITAFPVIYTIVREFNLLSSDIGRMALSTAVISDMIGINGVTAFEAAKQGEGRPMAAVYYLISLIIVNAAIFGGIRQLMLWIVQTTPEGKPVDELYIVLILVGVAVVGFVCDMTGLAIANGPLWLGLAVPDGPPLGATLVEKSETFLLEILLPFSYVYIGLYTDVFSLHGKWLSLRPLFYMVACAYLTKLVATLFAARWVYQMPLSDSFALSLIMSLRGQVELILFIHWSDLKMITQSYFTMLVLTTTAMTAIASPLINIIYDPTRPYMLNKRRNIQHNPPNMDFKLVLTIDDEESVPGFINLFEVSNPTPSSPIVVYALRLIQLVGRATPLFIDHDNQEQNFNYNSVNPIHNALKYSHESMCGFIRIHPFTSVSPKRSMYQDICELALTKKVSLILLPYNKDLLKNSQRSLEAGEQKNVSLSINSNIFSHAPCSVGVFVDKGFFQKPPSQPNAKPVRRHFAVLFLGGPDARETLAYADRMVGHPDLSLTVVRFLAYDGEGDDTMEKKLDDGLVTWFWVKNEGNRSVIYREVVVKNGEETMAAIQSINDVHYDLWIVGRGNGMNRLLVQGLTTWSDNDELGIIGEYVSSSDVSATASVLVMQQQILRDQEPVKPKKRFNAPRL